MSSESQWKGLLDLLSSLEKDIKKIKVHPTALGGQVENIDNVLKVIQKSIESISKWENGVMQVFGNLDKELKDLKDPQEVKPSNGAFGSPNKCQANSVKKNLEFIARTIREIKNQSQPFLRLPKVSPLTFDEKPGPSSKWQGLESEDEITVSPATADAWSTYDYLEPHLKVRFLCLSIFPENSIIKKRTLKYWWIGENFARPNKASKVADKDQDGKEAHVKEIDKDQKDKVAYHIQKDKEWQVEKKPLRHWKILRVIYELIKFNKAPQVAKELTDKDQDGKEAHDIPEVKQVDKDQEDKEDRDGKEVHDIRKVKDTNKVQDGKDTDEDQEGKKDRDGKEVNDIREVKKTNKVQEGKDKDQEGKKDHDIQEVKETNKVGKDTDKDQDDKEAHDIREVKETNKDQDGKETHDIQEIKETNMDHEGKEAHDIGEVKETDKDQDGKGAHDIRKVKETSMDQESKEAHDIPEVKEVDKDQEGKQSNNDQDDKEAHDSGKVKQVDKDQEGKEAHDTGEVKETDKDQDGKETHDIGEVKQVDKDQEGREAHDIPKVKAVDKMQEDLQVGNKLSRRWKILQVIYKLIRFSKALQVEKKLAGGQDIREVKETDKDPEDLHVGNKWKAIEKKAMEDFRKEGSKAREDSAGGKEAQEEAAEIPEGKKADKIGEDFEEDCFKKLCESGLIEPIYDHHSTSPHSCMLHPWIRWMAIRIAKETKFFDFESDGKPSSGPFACPRRACVVTAGEKQAEKVHFEPYASELLSLFNVDVHYLECDEEDFKKLNNMKAMQLGKWIKEPEYQVEVVNSTFLNHLGLLKNLRYLGLQGISRISELPESIAELSELRILDLRSCHHLLKLPTGITSLKKLTHLDVSECYLIEYMPQELGSLSELQVLAGFVISKWERPDACKLSDLTTLQQLRKLGINLTVEAKTAHGELEALEKIYDLQTLTITWAKGVASLLNENDKSEKSITSEPSKISLSLPSKLTKLDLRCFPNDNVELQVKQDNLKKLYFRGGRLTSLSGLQNCKVERLRLRLLMNFSMAWEHIKEIFTELKYIEIYECPINQTSYFDGLTHSSIRYRIKGSSSPEQVGETQDNADSKGKTYESPDSNGKAQENDD